MVIGILGKGGSGKTTTSTLLVKHLSEVARNVLAIDADHNMDLAYNLGAPEEIPFFGRSLPAIKKYQNIDLQDSYKKILESDSPRPFTISPPDTYIEQHSVTVGGNIRLMVAGPHTDEILFDKSCSHVLTTPLKVFLPLLRVGNDDFVIVDEKAGLDGVGTGVTTGFHLALVVAEPTPHSIKAARGIIELLEFYQTPYGVILTKNQDETEKENFRKEFGEKFVASLSLAMTEKEKRESLSSIIAFGRAIQDSFGDTRLERTRSKLERNTAYQMQY